MHRLSSQFFSYSILGHIFKHSFDGIHIPPDQDDVFPPYFPHWGLIPSPSNVTPPGSNKWSYTESHTKSKSLPPPRPFELRGHIWWGRECGRRRSVAPIHSKWQDVCMPASACLNSVVFSSSMNVNSAALSQFCFILLCFYGTGLLPARKRILQIQIFFLVPFL